MDAKEQVAVRMCYFDGIRRGNCFGGKPIKRNEVEVKVRKLKNGNAACKGEVTGEMIIGEGDMVVDWILRLCNMAYESDVVQEG